MEYDDEELTAEDQDVVEEGLRQVEAGEVDEYTEGMHREGAN